MITLRPGTSDQDIHTDVFVRQYHVPPDPITPKSILDLGANIGLTMLHYSQLWPEAKILGVELDEANAELARHNSGKPVIHAAVAAIAGQRHYRSGDDPCTYRLMPDGDKLVPAMTLAEILRQMGGADLVKMDIEGAEWEVVQSAGWCDLVGSLLVEVHGGTCSRMIELLEERGFRARSHAVHWSSVWAIKA